MAKTVRSEFRPLPPQRAFIRSKAKIRGYGGAMAGGKTRTLCEDTFDQMLEYPGLSAVLFRESHTSIVETTRKAMLEVVPSELIARTKASMGEDFIELWNGSRCHFAGLDNPYRWYSAELGWIAFDEAQEIHLDKVVRLLTRLRQQGMPNRAAFTFNPSSPGHWLQQWFYLGGERTDHGFYKSELFATEDATAPVGDCEFFFSKASDNIHLPDGYLDQTLSGLPPLLRQRYRDGDWVFTEGNAFFDSDVLTHYRDLVMGTRPLFNARTAGDVDQDFKARARKTPNKDRLRIVKGDGPWSIWKLPVRSFDDEETGKTVPAHRYVMAVDVSSGGSYDYSAIQIVCVETWEQVAEFQGKLTPNELAVEAYRMGRIYNDAYAVPEITGGWGYSVSQELQRLHYPRQYTRRVFDRIAKKFTDKLGWDTTVNTRAHMLDTLERVLDERELRMYSLRTLTELETFVFGKNNKPEAQDGCNDDLVVALAIAVTVATELPRELRRPKVVKHTPKFQLTGY